MHAAENTGIYWKFTTYTVLYLWLKPTYRATSHLELPEMIVRYIYNDIVRLHAAEQAGPWFLMRLVQDLEYITKNYGSF